MKIKDLEGLTKGELREGLCNLNIERAKAQASLERLEQIYRERDNPNYVAMIEEYSKLIENLERESRVYRDAISYKN